MTDPVLSDSVKKMLSVASDYCGFADISRTTLGRFIVNDGKFFDRIEGGGGCTMDTYEKVMRWFQDNMPRKPTCKKRNGHVNGIPQ